MEIKGIGINADSSRINGDLELLERDLALFREVGFDYVEIPVEGVDGIVGGRLNPKATKRVQEVLRKYHLKATVHAPSSLHLRKGDLALKKSIFRSSVEFAWCLGARTLVYHGGDFSTFKRAGPIRKSGQDLAERKETEVLKSLGDLAAERGVEICIENGAYPVEDLVRMVMNVERQNVGIR